MRRLYTIVEKISTSEVRAVNAVGRSSVFQVAQYFNVGDTLIIVNGVVVRKTKKEEVKIFNV